MWGACHWQTGKGAQVQSYGCGDAGVYMHAAQLMKPTMKEAHLDRKHVLAPWPYPQQAPTPIAPNLACMRLLHTHPLPIHSMCTISPCSCVR